jgi:hypothetical protein
MHVCSTLTCIHNGVPPLRMPGCGKTTLPRPPEYGGRCGGNAANTGSSPFKGQSGVTQSLPAA